MSNVCEAYLGDAFDSNSTSDNVASIGTLDFNIPICNKLRSSTNNDIVKVTSGLIVNRNVSNNGKTCNALFPKMIQGYTNLHKSVACIFKKFQVIGTQFASVDQLISFTLLNGFMHCENIELQNLSTMDMNFVKDVTSEAEIQIAQYINNSIEQILTDMINEITNGKSSDLSRSIITNVQASVNSMIVNDIVHTSITKLQMHYYSSQKIVIIISGIISCDNFRVTNEALINLESEQIIFSSFEAVMSQRGVNYDLDRLIEEYNKRYTGPPKSWSMYWIVFMLIVLILIFFSILFVIMRKNAREGLEYKVD